MNNCSVDLQRRIITAMEEAVFTLPGQPTIADVEEYIGLKISKKFTFKSVRDNIPIRIAFKEVFGDVDLSDSGGSALHYSNIIKNVRSYSIDDLFHGLPAAKVEFEGYSTRLLVGEGILGKNNKSSYAFSDNDLNNNFKDLKNNLFEKIQKFLTKKNKYRGKIFPLFDKDGVVDYNHYVNIMNILDQYFFNNLEMPTITSYTGKKVPELSYNFNTNRDIFEAYYDMIVLTNFDSVINSKFSKYFKVNINKMNLLDLDTGDNLKYTLVFDPTTSLYWNKEDHESESSEGRTDWFTKNLVTLIPQYNRQGEKTPNYMEVNDFYLLAAKFAEFELLEGNRLKNDKNNEYGFDYFNNKSVERFQWYLENIKKSVNKEIGSLPSLATYFGDVYDKILSIDKFINESEYNIAEKERNSGNSLITFMTQVINNNFGSSYSIYNTDGTYTTQEMYQQDFNSTRVQSSLFSAMKINYMDKSFYDLTDAKELKRFNGLFPSNLENISNMVEAIETKAVDYIKINKYIKDKTGIPMTRNSLISAIKDMSMNIYDGNPVTGYNFRLDLEKLITYGLNKDFNSDSFKESVEQSSGRNVNFDSTIKDVIPESIKQPLFIALKSAYLENFTIKAVMNVNTSKDTTLPTFKVGNLTYKDTELFDLRREYERETAGLLFNSLLIRDDPAIVGTSTKLEVVGAKRSKMYDELTPIEQFTSDFKYDFIANAVNNNKFSVIIGNYSDKSTILAKVINGDFILNKEERNVTILKESIDNILEAVRVQGYSFYGDTLITVFNDYKEVFDALGIKHKITPNNFDMLNTNISEVNRILTSLTTKERSPIIELNSRLSKIPVGLRPKVALTEELHYSKYADGTFLNNFLIDNFTIFSDSDKNGLFHNDFVKQNERKFLEKFSNNAGKSKVDLGLDTRKIDKVLTTFNLTSEDFKDSSNKINYNSVTLSEDKLNPLIKKWMWTNALFRNEYLFISTKGEYMHPHKQRELNSRFGKTIDTDYKNSYFSEMSGRLSSMAKRNVTNTASVELPVRHSKGGIPDDLNVAAIEDFKSNIYTTSGYSKKGQDAHDGSSFLEYTYSKMLDESFPGKGYFGTKKQFGTLITPNGVTIKKDAESVITNNKIRTSGEISFLTKKKQMLGIPIGNVALEYSSGSLAEYYIIKNGERQKVNSIKIFNKEGKNFVTLNYSPRVKSSDGNFTYRKAVDLAPVEVDSLFDIWQAIGAEFSVDADGNFNEESNEKLYDIIINTNEGILKNKMIHVLSNHTALKAGAAGLNGRHLWTENGSLLFSTYKSRFMGPQLDASHEADDSEIKEVSQVISALSQGGFTSDLANEVYSDIARIIKQSMDKYVKLLKPGKEDREKLYRILSNKFISSIRRSDREEVTKAIIDSLLANNVRIPFSNQNFYNLFVREIVTTLNNEFISRHYSGMGGVLIPSHGIFQVYDVYQPEIVSESGEIIEPAKWVVKTKEDLYKEALDRHSLEGRAALSNDQIVNDYINEVLPDYRTTVDKIELGDTVRLYGALITLDTAEKYYNFKNRYSPSIRAFKVISKARDLKPTLHTFSQNVTLYGFNNEPYTWELTKNTFDLQPLQLLYKSSLNILSEEETAIINNLNSYLDSKGNPADTETFLRAWLQRDLELLEHDLVMRDISLDESFYDFFRDDNVLRDVISDVIDSYKSGNMSVPIYNLSFSAAEISMGDIYKTKFGKEDSTSMAYIKSKGYEYFADKLNSLYDTTDETEADIKIITDDISTPIYIKFVNSNSGGNEVNLRLDPDVDYDLVARYDELGNRLYTIPDPNNTRIKSVGEKEIIEIKIGNLKKDKTILSKDVSAIQKNLKSLINSFSNVKAVIPLGKGVLGTVYNEETKVTTEKDGSEKTKKAITSVNVENIVSNAFSDYTGIPLSTIKTDNKNWFKDNKKLILNRIAKTTYASWEKSHDVVASRIPSQSMQSFMPMKNIAYMPGGTNDVYVSIHQIFLQGSDFDIDKAYILGNGYSNRGKIDLWTNLSNYSNTDQLTALMNLPVPNQTTLTISNTIETEQIMDSELVRLYNSISQSVAGKDTSYELPAETISFINLFMRRIDKISKNKTHNLYLPTENVNMSFEALTNLINGHNSYEDYLNKNHAVKNSVVHNISKIISSPSNQIHANTPVTVDNLHNAADRASAKYAEYLDRKIGDNDLSSYDMMSYYQQQFNASVGKDDVGIAANGLKGLFALTSYYNNYFKNRIPTKEGIDPNRLRTSNKIFKKSYDFVDDFGKEIHISIGSISDIVISKAQESALKDILGPEYSKTLNNAAVLMSSFTSAATDNAKELIMAKINASTKLASMHAYMMALGFTLDQIVEFMTSETSSLIINESTDNIYYDESPKSITGVIDKLKEDANINQAQLKVFEAIYKDSKEFTALTGFLGINQKRKADTWEMYNYLNKFTKVISDSESSILKEYKKNVGDLKKLNEATNKMVTISNLGDLDFDTFFSIIINDKPYLSNDREYIKNIFDEVRSYVLKDDTPRKGETVKIIGNFDLNLYLSDSGYQAVVKKYYNLIKRTFNVFDIIEDVPHFREMINSLKMSNHMLQTMTAKYKFTTKTLSETITKHSHALDKNGETKYVGKKNLLRGSNYFDVKTTETWLKTDRMGKFTFNVSNLLKQANINEITLYTSDSAINNPDQVEVVNQNSDFTISLDTNYGIANFKRVMEQVILPLLQSYDNSNMTENLRVETVNNLFGLKTNSIVSAYSLKALNSPVAIHQFNSLLSAFNSLDSNIQTEGKIKNSYGEELKWRDLFYIYNLAVNNERYGDKRLTPLFRDYIKERGSLALDYIEFYSKVDNGDVDIFYYDLYNSPEYNDESVDNLVEKQKELKDKYEETLIRDMLIYAFQERGVLDEAGTETTIINNSDFVIATNIQGKYDSSFIKMREILRKINLGGFVIEFKC